MAPTRNWQAVGCPKFPFPEPRFYPTASKRLNLSFLPGTFLPLADVCNPRLVRMGRAKARPYSGCRNSIWARHLSFLQEFVQTFLTKIYSYDSLCRIEKCAPVPAGALLFWDDPAAHGFAKGLIQKRLTQGPQSPGRWGIVKMPAFSCFLSTITRTCRKIFSSPVCVLRYALCTYLLFCFSCWL